MTSDRAAPMNRRGDSFPRRNRVSRVRVTWTFTLISTDGGCTGRSIRTNNGFEIFFSSVTRTGPNEQCLISDVCASFTTFRRSASFVAVGRAEVSFSKLENGFSNNFP